MFLCVCVRACVRVCVCICVSLCLCVCIFAMSFLSGHLLTFYNVQIFSQLTRGLHPWTADTHMFLFRFFGTLFRMNHLPSIKRRICHMLKYGTIPQTNKTDINFCGWYQLHPSTSSTIFTFSRGSYPPCWAEPVAHIKVSSISKMESNTLSSDSQFIIFIQ